MRDYRQMKSAFCNPKAGLQALEKIVARANYKHLLLRYNDEGIMSHDAIVELLERRGRLEIAERPYTRYKSNGNGAAKNGVVEKLYYLKNVNAKNTLHNHSGAEWTQNSQNFRQFAILSVDCPENLHKLVARNSMAVSSQN